MKSPRCMSDAGSTPATSTTTGVSGFDGILSVGGQSAMVPAAPGSAKSRRPGRWAKPELPMTTAITSRFCALRDVPRSRGVTKAARVVPATRGASFAGIAQLAERGPSTFEVVGSSPTVRSTSPWPVCAHGSDRQLRGHGRCDLSGAGRLQVQKRTCGPVRERGANCPCS